MRPCDPDMTRDYIVRVHALDPAGIPYPDPLVGRGAYAYKVSFPDGDDQDVDWSASTRYGPLRVGLRTTAVAKAARFGPGNYCLELFAPANDHTWIHLVFPKMQGAVLEVPTPPGSEDRLYAVTGTVAPNRHLPNLIAPDAHAIDGAATMDQSRTAKFNPLDLLKGTRT